MKILETKKYLQGHNIEDIRAAGRIAEEVLAMCPENPITYVILSDVYWMAYWLGPEQSRRESIEKGIEMAQKAIAMDDSIPYAYSDLGLFYGLIREYDKAIEEGERAVALAPGMTSTNQCLAMSLHNVGREEEAIPLFQKAIRLNPVGSTGLYLNFGHSLRGAGRFDEAVAAYKKSVQRARDNIFAHIGMAVTCIMMGREEEARAEAAEVLRINPNFSVDSYARSIVLRDQSETNRVVSALRKTGLK